MLGVHLDGAFYLSQPAYRVMHAQGGGRFVFIASSAGLFGQPNAAHYAAAKAGIQGLANVIAIEGAEHNILANTVLPFGNSRMVTESLGEAAQLEDVVNFVNAIAPEFVVPIVTYLASTRCDFTHQSFSACAGRFARVFAGLAEGWWADAGNEPTAEHVAEHIAAIAATEPYTVPTSIFDEVAGIFAKLGVDG
jgi:NAD(P)-dependent dehydrogenase (short-subunit alcohol dehydrogenase family)